MKLGLKKQKKTNLSFLFFFSLSVLLSQSLRGTIHSESPITIEALLLFPNQSEPASQPSQEVPPSEGQRSSLQMDEWMDERMEEWMDGKWEGRPAASPCDINKWEFIDCGSVGTD